MVELYLHSPIHLNGVMLNFTFYSTGTRSFSEPAVLGAVGEPTCFPHAGTNLPLKRSCFSCRQRKQLMLVQWFRLGGRNLEVGESSHKQSTLPSKSWFLRLWVTTPGRRDLNNS
jgi:hypothetical protein